MNDLAKAASLIPATGVLVTGAVAIWRPDVAVAAGTMTAAVLTVLAVVAYVIVSVVVAVVGAERTKADEARLAVVEALADLVDATRDVEGDDVEDE